MAKIFVSAGHSSSDPGAVYHGTTEYKELNKILPEAIRLAKPHLKSGDSILEVPAVLGYIEAVQWFLARADRRYDLFTEPHLNANVGTPGTGTETFYGGLKVFADSLNNNFVRGMRKKYTKWANRGVKFNQDFYITNVLRGDGNIIELGFLNNRGDVDKLRIQAARSFAEALISVSHGKPMSLPAPKPAPIPVPKPSPPLAPIPKQKYQLTKLAAPLSLSLRRDAHLVSPDKNFASVIFSKSGSGFRAFATFETERKYYVTEWSYKQWQANEPWNAIEADALNFPDTKQLKDIEAELSRQDARLSAVEKFIDYLKAFFK